jgi:DNA-binding response OmpR family regulator
MLEHPPSVLVVEDEESIRTSIVSVLRDEGFDVASAESGWAALDIAERKKFDLLVTDIGLPDGLDGIELAQCVRTRRPALRCLFISGLRPDLIDDPERDDFVGKPFRQRELVGCIWELLQRQVPVPSLDWNVRQAERSLVAAKVDCRRQKREQEAVPHRPIPRRAC